MTLGLVVAIAAFFTLVLPIFFDFKVGRYRLKKSLFIFCALITLAGAFWGVRNKLQEDRKYNNNIKQILERIELEGTRLHASDFQIRILVNIPNEIVWNNLYNFKPETIHARLGEAFLTFELNQVGSLDRKRAGRSSTGNFIARYYSQNLTIGGLDQYNYLRDLDNAKLKFKLPPPISKYSSFVDLYIIGKHWSGNVSPSGEVEVAINIKEN